MKKIYQSPEVEVVDVILVDCLAISQSILPENPIPDVTTPSDDGDFDFDFNF